MNKLVATSILISIVLFGTVTGWLVGASNTPVVSAFLPLIFGVMTYIVTNIYTTNVKDKMAATENSESLDASQNKKMISVWNSQLLGHTAMIAAMVLGLLSISTFAGVQLGVAERWGGYISHLDLLNSGATKPSPDVAAGLLKLTSSMRTFGIGHEDYNAVIGYVKSAVLSNPKYGDAEKVLYLSELTKAFQASSTDRRGLQTNGRGPAY